MHVIALKPVKTGVIFVNHDRRQATGGTGAGISFYIHNTLYCSSPTEKVVTL